jgi:hypothetical protein
LEKRPEVLPEARWGEGRGKYRGQGSEVGREMAQTMYTHMNKRIKKK